MSILPEDGSWWTETYKSVNKVVLTHISALRRFLYIIPGKKLLTLMKERLKYREFLLVFPFTLDTFPFISKFYRFAEYCQNFYSESDNTFNLLAPKFYI
jgi:hypothetical protein